MLNRKKIFFILPSLKAGGAERVISYIAQQLDSSAFEVKLIIIGYKKDSVFETDQLKVEYLNISRLLFAIPVLFRVLYKEKPKIVISSIAHVNILMGFFSFFLRDIKFIGREASVFSKMNEFSQKTRLQLFLIKLFYSRLASIICQSEDMKADLVCLLGLDDSKFIIIHNPITQLKEIQEKTVSPVVKFITIGRLSREKGHLRIISALAHINKYDFHYTIVGEGPEKELIQSKIEEYRLNNKVSFISFTSKVLEQVMLNDCFIQGSYVEGFPNALLESCSVGVPVIAFEAPGGTKDIIINGVNGFLIKNEKELIDLLNDIDVVKNLNRRDVYKSIEEKFSSKRIVNQYQELFLKI